MTDLLQLSLSQFTNAWRLMCRDGSRYAVSTTEGVELVFSGLPIAFFNIGFVTGRDVSAGALAASAGRASDWAARQGVPWLFVVTHEALQAGVDATAALDAAGLAPLMPLTGMIASRVAPLVRPPDGLQLTAPEDDEACATITAINAKAYAMELDAANEIIGRRSFWRDRFAVVAWASGTPVACAAAMMVDGHRYVALVATDPAHQKRGYADAAMRRALGLPRSAVLFMNQCLEERARLRRAVRQFRFRKLVLQERQVIRFLRVTSLIQPTSLLWGQCVERREHQRRLRSIRWRQSAFRNVIFAELTYRVRIVLTRQVEVGIARRCSCRLAQVWRWRPATAAASRTTCRSLSAHRTRPRPILA